MTGKGGIQSVKKDHAIGLNNYSHEIGWRKEIGRKDCQLAEKIARN